MCDFCINPYVMIYLNRNTLTSRVVRCYECYMDRYFSNMGWFAVELRCVKI